MKNFEPGNNCIHLVREIPPDTIQFFLPLYLKHPATIMLRSAGVQMCGISETTPGFHLARIAEFKFAVFTTSGHGIIHVGNQEYDLPPHSFFIAPSNIEHNYRQTGKAPWRFLWFHLLPLSSWLAFETSGALINVNRNPQYLENALTGFAMEIYSTVNSQINPDEQPPWTFYRDSHGLHTELHEFHLTPLTFAYNSDRLAELHGSMILGYLEREIKMLQADFTPEATGNRIEKLWEKLNHCLGRHWTLEEMAAAANMSVPTLIRQCKKRYDGTPMKILYHLRLKHAVKLLLSSNTSIGGIAEEIGYDNASSFTNVFKQEYNATPLEYRKKYVTYLKNACQN